MSAQNIYTVGGTVQAGQGIYIPRQADDELLSLCRAGTFAHILTARQMGKSSLMVRTAQRLEEEGTRTALIDLTKLGAKASAEQWYLGFLVELADQLGLATDMLDWWTAQEHLPMAQRLSRFCTEVVLDELTAPVVVFIDEIDSTLSLDFTDDFFAAIRALYNARAGDEAVRRLTFVLIGVATPGDLIRDLKRTPFNIGARVDLDDFTETEAAPLTSGFGLPTDDSERVLADVLRWTGGHPYLTQRLCQTLAVREEGDWDAANIDATVQATFFGEQSERDHNLQFVRDMLVKRSPDQVGVLRLYQAIRLGRRQVPDEEQSLIHAHLKLSGVVRRSDRHLHVRNQVYATVFNPTWIKQRWPLNWWQGIPLGVRIASGFVLVLLVVLVGISTLLTQALDTSEMRRLAAVTSEARAQVSQSESQEQAMTAQVAQAQAQTQAALAQVAQAQAQTQAALAQQAQSEAQGQATAAKTAQAETQGQLRVSDSQRLAFVAQRLPDEDQEPALQLAYEAYALDQNSNAEQVLHDLTNRRSWQVSAITDYSIVFDSVVFGPDSSRILTIVRDGTAQLWDANGQPLATLSGHPNQITGAMFSPDGKSILTTSFGSTAQLWDANGQPLATLSGHTDRIWKAVFSPDGTRILTASNDKTARLWNVSGQLLTTFSGHTGVMYSAVFSPDGTRILTTSSDGTARLWDVSGKPLATLSGNTDAVNSAVFSPDGTRILTTSSDGTGQLWDVSGQFLTRFSSRKGVTLRAEFSPDGSRILTASQYDTAHLWDANGEPLVTLSGHTGSVNSAVFSPDGTRILTASDDGTARLWDASGQLLVTFFGHTGAILSAVFSPDGARILTASDDGTARLWDASGQPLDTLIGHTDAVLSAVFSPDGRYILTASDDRTARLWDANDEPLATLSGHTAAVNSAVFSPDGKRILTASDDKTARLWDTSGQLLVTFSGHTGAILSAVFSPDGTSILTASRDGTARLSDVAGQHLDTLFGHTAAVLILSMVFSSDGKYLLITSQDETAQLWHMWDASGEPLLTFSFSTLAFSKYRHQGAVLSAVFSPDGTRILTASADGTARLWYVSGYRLVTLLGHKGSVNSAVFSPDGTRILTASDDGTARLWNASGYHLATLAGHTGSVNSAVFSPDSTRILTASDDGTARLWDASGHPLATLASHTGSVNSAVFSPDGTRILTASQDGTARQYFVNPNDLLAAAACRIGRELTDDEIARYNVPTPLHFKLSDRQCPLLGKP